MRKYGIIDIEEVTNSIDSELDGRYIFDSCMEKLINLNPKIDKMCYAYYRSSFCMYLNNYIESIGRSRMGHLPYLAIIMHIQR